MKPGRDQRRAGATVLALAGAALVAWLLFRARGWGLGWGIGATEGGRGGRATPLGAPCLVRIDPAGIEVDGVRADLPTVISRCRAAGRADVKPTGDAVYGVVNQVVHELEQAGVIVFKRDPVGSTRNPA